MSLITRPNLKSYRARIESALKAEFADEGFDVEIGGCTFDPGSSFWMKTTFHEKSADERNRDTFVAGCALVGLKPEHFGAEFMARGEKYRVSGLNLNAPKFPIKAVRVSDGRRVKFQGSIAKVLEAVQC